MCVCVCVKLRKVEASFNTGTAFFFIYFVIPAADDSLVVRNM